MDDRLDARCRSTSRDPGLHGAQLSLVREHSSGEAVVVDCVRDKGPTRCGKPWRDRDERAQLDCVALIQPFLVLTHARAAVDGSVGDRPRRGRPWPGGALPTGNARAGAF